MDALCANGSTKTLDSIRSILTNEDFDVLKSRVGYKRARGRPCQKDQLKFEITNQLILQLHLVREETGCQLIALQALFNEMCINGGLPSHNVGHLIQTCMYQWCSAKTQADHIQAFLRKKIDLEWVGDYCKDHGITQEYLLALAHGVPGDCVTPRVPFICNGLLAELNTFKVRKGFSASILLKWLRTLSMQFTQVTTGELNRLVNKVTSALKGLRKRNGELQGAKRLQEYRDAPCISQATPSTSAVLTVPQGPPSSSAVLTVSQAASSSSAVLTVPQAPPSTSAVKVAPTFENNLLLPPQAVPHMVERQFQIAQDQIRTLHDIVKMEKATSSKHECEISILKKSNENLKRKLQAARKVEAGTKTVLHELKHQCVQLKASNISRKFQRLKQKYEELEAKYKEMQHLPTALDKAKALKRQYQKRLSDSEAKRKKLGAELAAAEEVIAILLNDDKVQVPETKTDSGFYKDFVIRCIYELIGEREVPAMRCREVIQTVSKHIFGVIFEDHQLPGKTSSHRFADQCHSLARMQVAEAVVNQHYDIHVDGATKHNRKYVGFQVTLENKETLSLGFEAVANETAQTLLQVTLDKVQELAELHNPEDTELDRKKILSNMISSMTDRANTMKCYSRLLDEHRKTEMPDLQLEFLHCNAHFLLALSSASEKALQQVEKDNQLEGTLGRDKLPAFGFNYKSRQQPAACRYVWTACDTIGPRGDEKNGCQADWQAFCASNKQPTHITSYRSNRFNNLFASSPGLVYHRKDIQNFFSLREPSNMKQKCVLADAECPLLDIMLLGLALMYIFLTGPFWVLVRSDTHYLDQYQFIQPMHSMLQEMCHHPDLLLTLDADTIPGRLDTEMANFVLQRRNELSGEQQQLLQQLLKALASEFVVAFERQLVDFLPGGKYGSAPSEKDRERMAHCKLTNLVGEACFADLDYSVFKNRRATLHHHSTINMVKRNQTISKWLHKKSQKDQEQLMKRARKLGPEHRQQQREQNKQVLHDLNMAMERTKREKQEAQQKQAEKIRLRKETTVNTVTKHGGPCRTTQDVVTLLAKFPSKKEKLAAIKAEIDFEKFVLGSLSPDLKTTKVTLMDLSLNFIKFKFGPASDQLKGEVVEACRCTRGQKRKAVSSKPESDSEPECASTESDTLEESEHTEDVFVESDFKFEFRNQGQTVAVYYDNTFYVGQVLQTLNPDLAQVIFMARGLDNTFKWPQADDIDEVQSKFVFDFEFEIVAKNRCWQVEPARWGLMHRRFAAFKQLFCS